MKKLLISAVVILATYTGFGQAKPSVSQPVWTKRVSRLISIADTGDIEKRKLRDESNGVSLAELLMDNVLKGKIRAYTAADSRLTQQLTLPQINMVMNGKPDTIEIEDPITKKRLKKIITRDFVYSEITHFRVLEEWSFDHPSAKTTIQIIGIAPVKDVYGDDGSFRGRMSLCWLRYEDVRAILEQYEQSHPSVNLALSVWNNYFTETEK